MNLQHYQIKRKEKKRNYSITTLQEQFGIVTWLGSGLSINCASWQ